MLDEALRFMSGSPIALRWLRKDGGVIWVEQRNNLIYDEAGELVVIEGIARDITECKRAEEKLLESEASLAQAQRIAHLGSWEYEAKNSQVYWSDETYRIFGFTPQQFVPVFEDFLNAIHPDDRVLVQEDMAKLLRGEQLRDGIEIRIVRADGEVRFVQSQRSATFDEAGELARMFGTVQDITERKRAEEQVRFQAHLLGQVQAAVIATDLQGTVTHWNEHAQRLYGWPPEEALGRNIAEMMFGLTEAERVEETMKQVMERLRTNETSEGEVMLRRKDGSTFFAHVINSVIHDAQGQAVGIVGISTDITKRKRAEEELRRRESKLTEAQRIAHVGNWSFDITRNEGHWSDEMYRTFGFAPQEFRVTYKKFLNLVHPDDKDLVRKAVRAAFYEDRDWHSLDYRLVRPDGAVRFLHSQYKIVRDESERSVSILGTSQDVTEHKQAEEELRKSEERFRRLVEQAANALLVHDLSGRFVEVNQQACKSLGYTQEELLTMSVSDIEENFDLQGLEEIWEQVGSLMIDGVHRRKDGTRFPVEIRVGLFEPGKERLMLAVARDITERKRAEEALRESEERYRSVVQQAAEGMFLVDLSTKRILEANDAYRALLGYEAEEMLGLTLYDVVAHDRKSIDFHVRRIVDEGNHVVGERHHRRKDGSLVEVEATASLISYGGRSALSVVAHDVTERKQAEEKLRKSEARNRAILEATPDLMFRVSRDGEYLDFRANDDSKLFIPREEIVGKTLRETMPPDLVIPMLRHVAKTLDTGEMQIFDYQLPVAGDMLDFEARLVVSGPGEVLSIVRDVTERKVLERRLEHQAFHDALTGLANRALFLDRLEHALSRSGRRHESVAVLFIDLDNFKVINDSLGHEAGDELLVAVAVRLQGCLRPEDTFARLGGDEFTILIEDVKGTSDATNVAERVTQALREPFVLRGQDVFVTASVGVALDDLVQDEPGGLLRSADLAMYRAKDNGKARYEVFDPAMNERALERLRLENEFRRALERNELKVYYQPKLQLVERNIGLQRSYEPINGHVVAAPAALPNPRIVGMEALVRWEHPELGLVAPPQFIPIAEETGLIVPMGRWVLREACQQARRWQESYPSNPPLTMSVNLSAKEFQQPDLAAAVAEILDETGLSPGNLDLEITESLLMEDTEHTVDTLRALKDLGVQLSIDDFGTGYSSLSYLDRFPVDNLKIDRMFVEKLGKSQKDTALVSTTITLSHEFGLKAIAEGLETADQLQRLRDLRCDQAQGYYFSKPLSSQAMSAMLVAGLESKVGSLPR